MVQKHGPNKNGDGWIPERIFISMPVQSGGGRTEGASTEVMQWTEWWRETNLRLPTRITGAAPPRGERVRAREKRASFRLLPLSLPALSGIISRRHLTILKTPERLHISRNRTSEASRFLPHADLVRTFTTFVLLLSRVSVR